MPTPTMTPPPPAPSRSTPSNFSTLADAFIAWFATLIAELTVFIAWLVGVAAAMNLNATTDTSTTSNAIGTGAKTFTVTAGKSFQPGMWLVFADTAAPSTNSMIGQVTSYSGTTLIVNIVTISGSGTKTAWIISQSVPVATSGLTAADNDSSLALATTAFAKSQDAVLHRDPDQGVALTAAASGSSGITVADNANINFGTGNFALVWKGINALNDQEWFSKVQDGNNRWFVRVQASTGKFNYGHYKSGGTTVGISSTTNAPTSLLTTINELAFVFNRETASAAGTLNIYINAVLFESVAIPQGTPADISNTAVLSILGYLDSRYAGTCIHAYTLNFAPTAAEVLDMYRNSIPESWKWGSQVSLVTNGTAWTGATGVTPPTGWDMYTTVTDYLIDGGLLKITSGATNAGIKQDISLPKGNKFRLSLQYKNTAGDLTQIAIYNATLAAYILTETNMASSTDLTSYSVEFATDSGSGQSNIRIILGTSANGDIVWYDNAILTQLGATLALEPEGIGVDKWYDASSNGLNASYPTAGTTLTRPVVKPAKQGAVTAKSTSTSVTLAIADLLSTVITGAPATPATYTFEAGATSDAIGRLTINDAFEWTIVNTGAGAITVTSPGVDHTIVGSAIVATLTSARYRTVKTAASTFCSYRIN